MNTQKNPIDVDALKANLIFSFDAANRYYVKNDLGRNRSNSGYANGIADVLIKLGHRVNICSRFESMKSDYVITDSVIIDDKETHWEISISESE